MLCFMPKKILTLLALLVVTGRTGQQAVAVRPVASFVQTLP